MEKDINRKLILLLLVPFIVSLLINYLISIGINVNSDALLSLSTFILYLWQFAAIIFWFYVGKYCKDLKIPKMKSFILGNSLWMVSLLLYIWQFILLNDEMRNLFIAVISQHYPLGFISVSNRIIMLFTSSIDSNIVTIFSYLIMFIVFTIGFLYKPKVKYEKMDI